MDWITNLGIPQQYAGLATVFFVATLAIGAGIARVIGRREGPGTPRVKEFHVDGQLSDMGPVKELVEGVGLLFQQQVRANIALERCAGALEQAAVAYAAQIKAAEQEAEIAAEVDRRVNQQLRERRARARRKPAT